MGKGSNLGNPTPFKRKVLEGMHWLWTVQKFLLRWVLRNLADGHRIGQITQLPQPTFQTDRERHDTNFCRWSFLYLGATRLRQTYLDSVHMAQSHCWLYPRIQLPCLPPPQTPKRRGHVLGACENRWNLHDPRLLRGQLWRWNASGYSSKNLDVIWFPTQSGEGIRTIGSELCYVLSVMVYHNFFR